jgi:hypothetical protein
MRERELQFPTISRFEDGLSTNRRSAVPQQGFVNIQTG